MQGGDVLAKTALKLKVNSKQLPPIYPTKNQTSDPLIIRRWVKYLIHREHKLTLMVNAS